MKLKRPIYKRYFFIGIILIALGVTFTNTMEESYKHFGIVMIALGGLFFIAAMRRRSNN